MSEFSLGKQYGRYRITLRKVDHIMGTNRPTPHVEIWKGQRKVGNYDIASSKILFKPQSYTTPEIEKAIGDYLNDNKVKLKIKSMIEESYFDLSKPAGEYGGIPRGFKVTITVEFTEKSLEKRKFFK